MNGARQPLRWTRCFVYYSPKLTASRPEKFGGLSQLLFDAQQLVVLGHAIGARRRPVLIWPTRCDRQIGDKGIFRLAAAVRHDGGIAIAPRQIDRLQRFADCADLIHLDQNGIGDAFFDAPLEALGVGDK